MFFEEEKTMVCIREKVEDSWKGIETTVNEIFKTRVHFRPYQADRAFFTCKDEEEFKKFKDRNFIYLRGSRVIRLRRWIDDDGILEGKITFTGGWISISELPVNMWSKRNFERIANFCGGLIEIHEETMKMSNCLVAKIKARGNLSGFIPASISITGRGVYSLKLKNMSKLELGHRRFLLKNPLSAMDFAFSGICREDDDVEQGDWVGEKEREQPEIDKSVEDFENRRAEDWG